METELARYGSAIALPAVICLWVAASVRAPSAVRSREQRGVWLAVVSAAAAMTLNLPSVVNYVARDAASGHVVSLVRNCIGALSAGAVLYFVASATGRHRLRVMALVSTVLCPGVLLVLDGLAPPHTSHSFLADRYTSPSITYWLVLIVAHLLADSACSLVCWRYGRRARGGTLSVSLLVFGVGTFFVGLYWVVLLSEILLRNRWGVGITPLLMSIHGFLRAAALLVPFFTSFLRAVQDSIAAWRLWPLWHDLVTAVPNVVLSPPQGRVEELIHPAAPRGLLVYRKVIEIRDAILVLKDYAGHCDIPDCRDDHSAKAELSESGQPAVFLAHLIKRARQAKMDRKPELPTSFSLGALGSDDLDEEKRFLLDVARAYLNSPAHLGAERSRRTADARGPQG
ncbi:MAB_1171c family putative transporter [Streptomyces collinus]|uniref:MAB_1171c family putative transporter n=1 Tax=Streptomyces collinus TaxID=42684 RepID=UPI002941D3F4|nr:MAB_1171c family putative transporter [Streptomyces collinus]